MMSQCTVPKWNLRHQRQEQVEVEEESNRSSHVQSHSHSHSLHNSTAQIVPMSNYEVAELTWENGQIAMHELGGLFPSRQASTKPATWGRTNETLESIVHQAARHKQNANSNNQLRHEKRTQQPMIPCDDNATVDGKMLPETFACHQTKMGPLVMKKRTRSESNQCVRSFNASSREEHMDLSTCGSASATFCRDSDTTMMTWASFDSPPPTFRAKTAADHEDSSSHGVSENQDEDRDTKTETVKSQCSRRTRAAAVHNQSERRRRDRINQKMKALQKLVPNASKTDKASMLDEVIEYLKQLQAQVQVLGARQMPQMMMPLGMQQQLQMSLLARMGMGVMGMGMYDINSVAHGAPPPLLHPSPAPAAPPAFVPSPFMVPSVIPTQQNPPTPQANQDQGVNSSVPLPDPYRSFLPQSINMDLYNKMAALYWQQVNQTTQATANHPLVQGDRSTCSSKVIKE